MKPMKQKDKGLLRWDFRIKKNDNQIFIEYDGKWHYFPVRWGGISQEAAEANLKTAQHRDKIKDDYCTENCFKLLRIPYWEKDNISTMVEEFLNDCF
jgi:hypothetical protein